MLASPALHSTQFLFNRFYAYLIIINTLVFINGFLWVCGDVTKKLCSFHCALAIDG